MLDYDNAAAKNPHNPSNPPKLVTFGEQTFNEMCFVFIGGLSERVGRGSADESQSTQEGINLSLFSACPPPASRARLNPRSPEASG